MKENSIKEDIIILEQLIIANENCIKNAKNKDNPFVNVWKIQNIAIEHILSDYKRVLKENKILKEEKEQAREEWNNLEQESYETEQKLKQQIKETQRENEELNKNYNSLIDKIILKIDEYDYKFEKAKKQNKNDIADYYWDLIINFKKLLGGE